KSVIVRAPSRLMSSVRYVSTGFGPTSSEVGILEPVTITSSIVTPERSGDGAGDISWPDVTEAESRKNPALQIRSRPMDSRLTTTPFVYFPWFSEIGLA